MKNLFLWLFVLALFSFDLATKSWAFDRVPVGSIPEPITAWLSISTLTNPGGIWGMGASLTTLLTVVRVFAVMALGWLIVQQPKDHRVGAWTLALLLSGALGNLYDNLSAWLPWPGNGEVRDFIDVHFARPDWYSNAWYWPFNPWPTFNFADACISLGFVLLITGIAKVHLGRLSSYSPSSDEKEKE